MARNRGQRGYRPKQAHSLSVTRRAMNARMIDDVTWQFMQEKLLQQWSPEQISGHVAISHEAVYQRIYADKRAGAACHGNSCAARSNTGNTMASALSRLIKPKN